MLYSILVGVLLSSAASAASYDVSPENPEVGDTLIISGTTEKVNTELLVTASYSAQVKADNSKIYMVTYNDIWLSPDLDALSVTAHPVTNTNAGKDVIPLKIKVDRIITLREYTAVSDGIATIGLEPVYPYPTMGFFSSFFGPYDVTISGNTSSANADVTLDFAAKCSMQTDENGYFEYSYETSGVPAGEFIVVIDGTTIPITLEQPAETEPSMFSRLGNWVASLF